MKYVVLAALALVCVVALVSASPAPSHKGGKGATGVGELVN